MESFPLFRLVQGAAQKTPPLPAPPYGQRQVYCRVLSAGFLLWSRYSPDLQDVLIPNIFSHRFAADLAKVWLLSRKDFWCGPLSPPTWSTWGGILGGRVGTSLAQSLWLALKWFQDFEVHRGRVPKSGCVGRFWVKRRGASAISITHLLPAKMLSLSRPNLQKNIFCSNLEPYQIAQKYKDGGKARFSKWSRTTATRQNARLDKTFEI